MSSKTWRDANPPSMLSPNDGYHATFVPVDVLAAASKPKKFIHIDQSECISCEGCVDVCPWKCLHLVSNEAVVSTSGIDSPGTDPHDGPVFIVDDDLCTRCSMCVARCPTGVVSLAGLVNGGVEPHHRDDSYGFVYGLRLASN